MTAMSRHILIKCFLIYRLLTLAWFFTFIQHLFNAPLFFIIHNVQSHTHEHIGGGVQHLEDIWVQEGAGDETANLQITTVQVEPWSFHNIYSLFDLLLYYWMTK